MKSLVMLALGCALNPGLARADVTRLSCSYIDGAKTQRLDFFVDPEQHEINGVPADGQPHPTQGSTLQAELNRERDTIRIERPATEGAAPRIYIYSIDLLTHQFSFSFSARSEEPRAFLVNGRCDEVAKDKAGQ